jgi:hypothetical protein
LVILIAVAFAWLSGTRAARAEADHEDDSPWSHAFVLPSLMFSNGELLTGTAALMLPWRVERVQREYDRRALRVEAGIATGGAHASLGVWREIDCPHFVPLCAGAYAAAQIFRAAWDSPWQHGSYVGVDAGAHMFLFKLAVGALVPAGDAGPIHWHIGLGLGW